MAPAPLCLPPNRFKRALLDHVPQIGLWSALCSNIVAEILAGSGFDWILLDMEHAPNEISGLISQMQAMATGTAEPIVRCVWNDAVQIKRILDAGARGILVPFVQNADEARHAVAAARYPKNGVRGVSLSPRANRYGRVANYHKTAHDEICVLVQVETASALKEIENIAAVEGVDGIFIGPSDLAADLGHLSDSGHPDVQAAIADACVRIRAAGKGAGMLTGDIAMVERYFEMGFTFVAVGSDVGLLARSSEALAAQCRQKITARRRGENQ